MTDIELECRKTWVEALYDWVRADIRRAQHVPTDDLVESILAQLAPGTPDDTPIRLVTV